LSTHSRIQQIGTDEIDRLTDGTGYKERIATTAEKVIRKLDPDSENITEPVLKEVHNAVTLIAHGSRDVVRENIIFDVVHHHVVKIIGSRW
jgi:peptidyl-tRNA hydrolase